MVPVSLPLDRRVAGLFCALLSGIAWSAERYPEPRRADVVETVHGNEVRDPYRWMENAGSAELESWLERQAELVEAFIDGPAYERTRRRILELSRYDLGYAARRRGDRLFYLQRGSGGSDVRILVRKGDQERVLVTAGRNPDSAETTITIGGQGFSSTLWPNRSGSLVAYGYTTGAGDGFWYFRMRNRPAADTGETTAQPAGLWFHALGTDQSEDVEVIAAGPGDRHLYLPAVTDDGERLVVLRREGTAPATSVLVFDSRRPDAPPVELLADSESRSIYLGNRGSMLFFQTTLDAPNGRVIGIDPERPEEIVEIVPEADRPMLAGSNVGGDVIGYFDGLFLLGYLQDGQADLRVHDHDGRFLRRIELPAGSSIWGTLDAVPGSRVVTMSLLNPFRPGHVVSIDLDDGAIETQFTADVPVEPDGFVVRRIFYESADGTRVPMSVVHRKNLDLDGDNPALIYGYSMHKWVSLLFYQAHIVHWLEKGGVYAMPAIRGGGEYGDAWHAAGIKSNRQNAVDDFVAAGRWLIDQGYTAADKLAANGGSASGALAGIVPVRYGATFAASTIDYPIADLARAHLFGNGALLVDEYGSLEDPAEAKALLLHSPYHAIDGPQCFPATLIMVGEDDKTALPFHGYKLAAAMQYAQSCDAPVLLHLMRDTGHNYGLSAEEFAKNTAVQLMFLWRTPGGN